MTDFITITDDGERMTCKMPPAETIVDVLLADGRIIPAWYDSNIMDAGDWDFVPVEDGQDEPDINADSIADQVIAWRKRS